MTDELDRELAVGLLRVPPDFEQCVMARINAESLREEPASMPKIHDYHWLEWLGLASGTVIGLIQLASLMFGVWSASSLS